MTNGLRVEPFSGISGDMFLAAASGLLDTRLGDELLAGLPARIGLPEIRVWTEDAQRNSLACRKLCIEDPQAAERKDHVRYREVMEIIDRADFPEGARQRAHKIFRLLAEAEAASHDVALAQVHFHEVGAVDSLIDCLGAALLLDALDIQQTWSDPVRTGRGFVETAHGKLPVPAPATERLLQGLPTWPGDEDGEMCTPTGAAILASLDPSFDVPTLVSRASAYGAGTRIFKHPNCLRLSRVEEAPRTRDSICCIETNLDDCPGELLGNDFQTGLLQAGAVDFHLLPCQMKKGRPGLLLQALCPPERVDDISAYILTHTPTLGVRIQHGERRILPRHSKSVETPYGLIRMKIAELPNGTTRAQPEYEDCAKAAREHGVPVQDVYRAAMLGH